MDISNSLADVVKQKIKKDTLVDVEKYLRRIPWADVDAIPSISEYAEIALESRFKTQSLTDIAALFEKSHWVTEDILLGMIPSIGDLLIEKNGKHLVY